MIIIIKILSCDGIFIECCQCSMFLFVICPCTMFVFGIDKAATDSRLHINEVKFDDSRYIAPFLLIEVIACTLLSCQFQIYTRGQSYFVIAATVIPFPVVDIGAFPIIIGSTAISISVGGSIYLNARFVSVCICIFCLANICKMYITTQGSQIVHDIIDTEVISMNSFIISICSYF